MLGEFARVDLHPDGGAAVQGLERDTQMLRQIPLFAGLPAARLKLIAYAAEVVHFEAGEAIVRQGEFTDAIHLLMEGEAEGWLMTTDGHGVRLSTMGRHSLFGETAVLCHGRCGATVRATSRVVALRIPASVFLGLVRESPDIAMGVMTLLAQRLEQNTALLQHHDDERDASERKEMA